MIMHNYNTIIGVIEMRENNVSYPIIRQRYAKNEFAKKLNTISSQIIFHLQKEKKLSIYFS